LSEIHSVLSDLTAMAYVSFALFLFVNTYNIIHLSIPDADIVRYNDIALNCNNVVIVAITFIAFIAIAI